MAIMRLLRDWLSAIVDHLCQGEGIDVTDYIRSIERTFQIAVRADEAEHLQTLADLCGLIAEKRGEHGCPVSEGHIWAEVRRITSEEFGVDVNELHPGIRFVEDLCC